MKIKQLQKSFKKNKIDFGLLINLEMEANPNFYYLTHYNGIGALITSKKQPPFLIVPKMEYQRAKKSIIKRIYKLEKKKFFETIKETAKKRKLKTKIIGIDKNNFTLSLYKNFKKQFKGKIKDISLDCQKLREVKTEKEVEYLKKSCSYASNILKKTIKNFKNFKTESEVAAYLEYEAKKLGLQLSFPPVVASGTNASMPHHEPKNIKLKKGFCVIDFGIKHNGYCSDITRTIYLGKPNEKEKEIYNFLLKTQKNIIENIKINNNCGEIYNNCVKSLKQYSKYFTHGLGHGVGTNIHELPNLSLNSKDRIQKNMVFTIEPGIYIKNKLGIRIEDTILMKTKPIILTKAPKGLLTI